MSEYGVQYSMEKMLAVAEDAALAAGGILLRAFHDPNRERYKDGLPIADLEAEDLICSRIDRHFPSTGLRVEERTARNRRPKEGCDAVWLIDPHDGTSAAHKGYRGACVSIGMVRNGVPVLGVVFAYGYPNDRGELISWASGCGPVRRNGAPVEKRSAPYRATIMVSKYADRRSQAYLEALAPMRYRTMPGIAYRLAAVSAGDADAAISLHTPRDFDCVGGHALLRGVGLELYDSDGTPIRYDPGQPRTYDGCFGGPLPLCKELIALNWSLAKDGPSLALDERVLTEPSAELLVRDISLLNRAQGCWMGQLSGDALGSQVEFRTPDEIGAAYPVGVQEILDGGTFNTIAGQPTDDSEMALYMGRSIARHGRYKAPLVAVAYKQWYDTGPFDIGNTVSQAVRGQRAADPVTSMARAANIDSQANGAMMRLAPLAIFSVGLSAEMARKLARTDASLTHPNSVVLDANQLVMAVIRKSLQSPDEPEDLYAWARIYCEKEALSSEVAQWLRDAEGGPPDDFVSQMGWLRIALQNAFYHIHRGTPLQTALVETVGRGGDTDTNACIAGALLGAIQGLGAIPGSWQEAVLTCRPMAGLPYVARARPAACWPVDALTLAEHWALLANHGEQS